MINKLNRWYKNWTYQKIGKRLLVNLVKLIKKFGILNIMRNQYYLQKQFLKVNHTQYSRIFLSTYI